MEDKKTTIYGIHVSNLFDDETGGLWHDIDLRVNDTCYADAYRRITELVSKVFPTGKNLGYTVYVGIWDDGAPTDNQYTSVARKEFRVRSLPSTLDELNTAEQNEDYISKGV